MKCLVLGGDGFIGSHVVECLLRRSFDVTIYKKSPKNILKNLSHLKKDIKIVDGDFIKGENLEKTIKNTDYVFHFIWNGNPSYTADRPEFEVKTNLLPSIYLFNLCLKYKTKKIIFPSSGGAVYGDIKIDRATENTTLNPITPYGMTKMYVEQYLKYFKEKGQNYVIYRISNAFGSRQQFHNGQGLIPLLINKIYNDEEITVFGNPIRDYISVRDVSEFISSNFDKEGKFDLYNIGSGRGISIFELIKTIEKKLMKKARLKLMPGRSSDVKKIILDIRRIKNEFKFKNKRLELEINNMLTNSI